MVGCFDLTTLLIVQDDTMPKLEYFVVLILKIIINIAKDRL